MSSPPAPPVCQRGHAMTLTETFRFDHEAGDDPHVTVMLERFRALGLELGAAVDLYECRRCNSAEAVFRTPVRVEAPVAPFTCPRCGAVSHHPRDREEGYCGRCHDWTAPPGA